MPAATQILCYNCFQQVADPAAPCPHCGFDLAENQQKFPVALRAGTVLNDRYIVGRVLGQGGFGITYVAFDTQLQARVAIKEYMPSDIATRVEGATVSVMMDTKADDFTYGAERFQEEARTLAKFIGHPNIAGVSSYFDQNDTSYFVMDYIEGVSFKSYIANNGGKVSVDETLNVMIPVLRALTAVHAEGFIHRDVTPDNIYISKDGNVKLLDFGSARYSIGDKSKSLDVILKVGYAPKEQYIRRGRQGPYTDVYSCAACFYAALTGYLPPESLERLDHDELVPVSQAGVEVPEWLDKAILKGLAVQPEDRFQSAAEFLDAIENQLVVDVPAAGQTASAQPAKKKLNPLVIGGAAAAIVVAVGLGVVLGGRGGGGNNDSSGGGGIMEALAPKVTIAGQEVSTAEEFLELTEGTLTDADIAEMKKIGGLKRIYLNGVTIETDGLDWVKEFPRLTEFSCQGYLMDELDLTPFAGLTELNRLGFYQNGNSVGMAVSDLSPIAGLTKMKRLDLSLGFEVTNLDALAGMTQLESLRLWGSSNNGKSGITDIGGLAGMTKLTDLQLNLGDVRDFSPLAGLVSLTNLNLYGDYKVEDLSPFAGMTKLTSLNIELGGTADFSPLAGMTSLTEMRIYGDYIIEDLSFLRNLTQLQSLQMNGGYSEGAPVMDDLSDLSNLTKLTSIHMNVPVASLDGLESLTSLRELQMYGSNSTYTDVDALAGLTELVTLNLPSRPSNYDRPNLPPIDLSGLKNLTKLQSLTINGDVKDLEPLRGLTELRSLHISSSGNDGVTDMSLKPLSGLTKLTELQINGDIEGGDLSPLSGLTELRSLSVYHYDRNYSNYYNRVVIRDLSPLAGLTKLNSLQVGETQEGIDTSPVAFVSDLNIT